MEEAEQFLNDIPVIVLGIAENLGMTPPFPSEKQQFSGCVNSPSEGYESS
jgi:hypothetical protein